jgi:methionyl-tRNA formyltransferase
MVEVSLISTMPAYLVVTVKSWNVKMFQDRTPDLPGQWHLITDKRELNYDRLLQLDPDYIFFPHWSWIVPKDIVERFNCVCFHMTDVPYGRGGSPLQNLIVRGHKDTKLTALKMDEGVDTGPVYMKRDLSLQGSAAEILDRAGHLTWEMIEAIVKTHPVPVAQSGEPTEFKRRKPEEGHIPLDASPQQIYDYIRMLDGEGYPPAFIDFGGWRLKFTDAHLSDNHVSAAVTFERRDDL